MKHLTTLNCPRASYHLTAHLPTLWIAPSESVQWLSNDPSRAGSSFGLYSLMKMHIPSSGRETKNTPTIISRNLVQLRRLSLDADARICQQKVYQLLPLSVMDKMMGAMGKALTNMLMTYGTVCLVKNWEDHLKCLRKRKESSCHQIITLFGWLVRHNRDDRVCGVDWTAVTFPLEKLSL